MSGQDWLEKDFYATLGVAKDADAATIKKAYRKLARQWHPDQNPGDAKAEEKFKEIGEAYAVLSDEEQRKQYDALRAMAGGGARFSAGGPGASGFTDSFSSFFGSNGANFSFSTSGAEGDLGDILSGMFGQGGFGGAQGYSGAPFQGASAFGQRTARPHKGKDRHASATVSFRDALSGTEVSMMIDSKRQKIRLPAGVKDGQRIRLRGKGMPGSNGGPAGDLEVTIRVTKHPVYTRDGDDLRITVPVSIPEAALGAKIQVPLIDGRTVTVKVPAGTQSGAVLRVRKEGVRTAKKTGDLLIDIAVVIPKNLSKDQKDALTTLADALGDADPRRGLAESAKE